MADCPLSGAKRTISRLSDLTPSALRQVWRIGCLDGEGTSRVPSASMVGNTSAESVSMTRTQFSFFVMIFCVAMTVSMLGKAAKGSTWHADKNLHGFYCPGGGKRVHLEDCPGNGGRRNGGAGPRNAAVHQACIGDAQRFCSAVIRDKQARRACMKAHRAELSAGCKEALAK